MPAGIGVKGQIRGPHRVDGYRAGAAVAHLLVQATQGVLVGFQTVGHEGLAHGPASACAMLVVEAVGNLAVAALAHEHL
jgi:hypothetical protein